MGYSERIGGHPGSSNDVILPSSRNQPCCLVLSCAAGVVVGLLASLHAPVVFGQYRAIPGQNPRNQQQQQQQQQQMLQQMQPQPVSIDGTVAGVTHGTIMVTDKAGKTWKVVVPATATVDVSGTASADYLAPNLTVDFKTDLDEHGAMKDKVSELTVITPSADQPMGILDVASSANAGAAAGGAAAGGGKGAKHNPAAAHGAAKSATAHGAAPAGPCRIVGKLTNNKGKLSVQVHGVPPIELALAEQVNIKVEFADYTVAANGDTIAVKATSAPGKMVAGRVMPNTSGMVQATDVKITLAEPLKGSKKKASSAKSPPPHEKKGADEGVPPLGS